jgi:hypothetical protein
VLLSISSPDRERFFSSVAQKAAELLDLKFVNNPEKSSEIDGNCFVFISEDFERINKISEYTDKILSLEEEVMDKAGAKFLFINNISKIAIKESNKFLLKALNKKDSIGLGDDLDSSKISSGPIANRFKILSDNESSKNIAERIKIKNSKNCKSNKTLDI